VTGALAIRARLDPNRPSHTSRPPQSIGKPKQSQLAIIIPSHCENKSNLIIITDPVLIVICPSRPVLSRHQAFRAPMFPRSRSPSLGALSCHQTYHRQAAREFAPMRIFSLVGPQTCIFGFLFLSFLTPFFPSRRLFVCWIKLLE